MVRTARTEVTRSRSEAQAGPDPVGLARTLNRSVRPGPHRPRSRMNRSLAPEEQVVEGERSNDTEIGGRGHGAGGSLT